MSRIGKQPVDLPAGVELSLAGRTITCKGPLGTLSYVHRPEVSIEVDKVARKVRISRSSDQKAARAYHGLTRALVSNMVTGVTKGYSKTLEIVGVGWTARVQGKKLVLNIGYADARELEVPVGLKVEVQGNKITVGGPDRQMVGQFAAQVRSQRPPEPYNGKGIKYIDELIVRKEGKAFASGAA